MPALLDQIDAEVASMTAGGVHDGEAVYDAVAQRHPDAAVIIPPRATAVSNESMTTQRDRHIAERGLVRSNRAVGGDHWAC
jgi:hypothetical protein